MSLDMDQRRIPGLKKIIIMVFTDCSKMALSMKVFIKAYARAGSVAQLVDGLSSMLKALSSISSITYYIHIAAFSTRL